MVSKTKRFVTKYAVPTQAYIGGQTYKQNPNKNNYDFLFWFVVNAILIFFMISVLLDNFLIEAVNWILDLFDIKYAGQFMLFALILAIDIIIVFFTRNINAVYSGLIAVLIYYALDYYYLVNEYTGISLLNFFG